jgi:hypothetical protein
MGRHERRAAVSKFRRELHHSDLLTFLVDAGQVPRDRRLQQAVAFWRSVIQQRRPYCPNCKANYADDAQPGAYLLTTPATGAASVSVTTFCDQCWRDLPISDIERIAARVLSAVIPNGRFEPLEPRR